MWHIAVVGCNELEIEGICSVLRPHAEVFELNSKSLPNLSANHTPDVILLNAELFSSSAVLLNFQIKLQYPDTKVVLLLSQLDEEVEVSSLKASIDGCVIKTQPSQLCKAIEIVNGGGLFYRRAILEKIIRSLSLHNQFSNLNSLSEQEQKILKLVKMGKTNKEIAKDLHISTETVKSHVRKIRLKLGLNNRRQLTY